MGSRHSAGPCRPPWWPQPPAEAHHEPPEAPPVPAPARTTRSQEKAQFLSRPVCTGRKKAEEGCPAQTGGGQSPVSTIDDLVGCWGTVISLTEYRLAALGSAQSPHLWQVLKMQEKLPAQCLLVLKVSLLWSASRGSRPCREGAARASQWNSALHPSGLLYQPPRP